MKLLTKIFVLSIILFSFILNPSLFAQDKDKEKKKGKIYGFEREVKKKDKGKKTHTEYCDSDDEEGDEGCVSSFASSLFEAFAWEFIKFTPQIFYSIFIYCPPIDSAAYEGKFWDSNFSHYPYVKSDVGRYSLTEGKSYAVNFSGHYLYESSNLQGFSLRGRISPAPVFGFDIDLTDFTEDLGTQEDYLQFYNIFVNYYRVRSEKWSLWWGLGLKGMKGENTYNGLAFNLGTEIYPKKPVSLLLNYNVGSLNGNSVNELLLRMNLHINRAVLYVGYQRFFVGSAAIGGVIGGGGISL